MFGEKRKQKPEKKKEIRTHTVNIIARERNTRGSREEEKMDDEERRGKRRTMGKRERSRTRAFHQKTMMHKSERCDYRTEEENERLKNARKQIRKLEKVAVDIERKPMMLWRLFRDALLDGGECRDIVEKHVLPRLNRTDVKFLYGVNTETRALIKRSPRAEDLKGIFGKFCIAQMSSISTLDFVLEHISLWEDDCLYDGEPYFCQQVAHTNKLELLKWAREEKKCKWDTRTIQTAAYQGNLEMVKYCDANECPIDEWACALAARNGHLEVLKYLREEVEAPWDFLTSALAAENGHLHILEYLVERKYDQYREAGFAACKLAAENGHLDCLKYLHETAKAPLNSQVAYSAHKNNHTECVRYLLEQTDCPLPRGWRCERGEHGQIYVYPESESEFSLETDPEATSSEFESEFSSEFDSELEPDSDSEFW